MDVLFLISFFRLYPGFKMSFEHNSVRKNLFLIACFCWDSRPILSELDQNFRFGGTIGYGDSYLDFLFHQFKVFRLHAILHDAAGAKVQATVTWSGADQIHVRSDKWLEYSFAFT